MLDKGIESSVVISLETKRLGPHKVCLDKLQICK